MKTSSGRVSLRYSRAELLRSWLRRRRLGFAAAALVAVAVTVALVGVQQDGRSNAVDLERRELTIDCVGADVVEVVATGRGPVSVAVDGAMSGSVDGDQRVVGQWSGGPGPVTITYVAGTIEWDAVYGFCTDRSHIGDTGGPTS